MKEAPSLRASLLRELSPTQAPIFADGHQRGLERSLRRGSPVRGRHGFWTCQGIPESGRMPLSCLPVFLNIEKPGIPRKAAVRYWFFLFATPERCFPRCRPPVRCSRIHVYKQWAAAGKVLGWEAWRGRPLSRGALSKVFPAPGKPRPGQAWLLDLSGHIVIRQNASVMFVGLFEYQKTGHPAKSSSPVLVFSIRHT